VYLGTIHSDQGDFPRSRQVLEQAEEAAREWYDVEAEVSACRCQSRVFMDSRNPQADLERAERLARKAVDLAKRRALQDSKFEATYNLGDLCFAKGRLEEAAKIYLRVCKDAKSRIAIRCWLSLAILATSLGRREEALQYVESATNASSKRTLRDSLRIEQVRALLEAEGTGQSTQQAYECLRKGEFNFLPARQF
jgi:tetratricopeptide (TPR) repeat protein